VVELFEGYQDLPLPTRLLIGLSHFFSSSWHWFVIGAGLLYAVYRRLASGAAGRLALDGLVLRIAPLRGFLLPVEIARFARTLALLIDSGVNVDRGLELAARTLRNSVLRAEIEEVRRGTVQQGAPMSVGLRRAPHIPPFVASMAAVGEESGRIDSALNEAALFLEREVEQKTRLATSLLEPVLILAVGAVVGMIVTAMLLPIFDLGKSMR
jgi:type II secretory pathway component PulF